MGLIIENHYGGLKTEKDHIFTEKAEKKYEELAKQWKLLTKNLTDEERADYNYLHFLFEEFLNICCKDHFTRGFKAGSDVTFKLTDKLLPSLDDDDSDDCE